MSDRNSVDSNLQQAQRVADLLARRMVPASEAAANRFSQRVGPAASAPAGMVEASRRSERLQRAELAALDGWLMDEVSGSGESADTATGRAAGDGRYAALPLAARLVRISGV